MLLALSKDCGNCEAMKPRVKSPCRPSQLQELVADSAKIACVHEESLSVLRFLSHPEKDDGSQNLPAAPAVQSPANFESHCP